MWLNADVVTAIGLGGLGSAAIAGALGDKPKMLLGLAFCMACWFTSDVMSGNLFCLLDLFVLAYAVHQRFPSKPGPVDQTIPRDAE